MRRIYFDIEADNLLYDATRIWCIATLDLDTGAEEFFGPDQVEAGIDFLLSADLLAAHNICGYDKPLINKLVNIHSFPKVVDTFILSSLIEPDRGGGHSIEAWGAHFNQFKPAHDDWTQFSHAMGHRCQEDVRIGAQVFKYFEKELNSGQWDTAIQLEQRVAELHAKQILNGVAFDMEEAKSLYIQIGQEMDELHAAIMAALPPVVKQTKTQPVKPFKANGDYSQAAIKWYEDDISIVGGPFSRLEIHEVNLSSPVQVKDALLSQGWEPTKYTDKGSPKLTEDSFGSIQGELGKQIARWMVLRHRKTMLFNINKQGERKGLVSLVRDDGRIAADGIPCGTPTGRYRHIGVVNIPSVDAIYGQEMRGLFIAPEGKLLVGTDACSLEARMEGHFTFPYDGGAYAKELVEGDIHQKNADLWNVPRRKAKNGKYCVPADTQVLTRHGWVPIPAVKRGDIVLGLNMETGKQQWTGVSDTVMFEKQDVYTIQNKWFKVRATSDHRWVVRQRTEALKRERVKIAEYPLSFRTTDELTGDSNIVINAPFNIEADTLSFSYTEPPAKYGFDWTRHVLNMCHLERRAFLHGFLIADGHFDTKAQKWSWYQNRNEHSEAALLASYLVHDGVISVNGTDAISVGLSKASHRTCQNIEKALTSTEDVHCITTGLGTFVMRQGDTITITGNCLAYGGQKKKLAETLGIPLRKGAKAFDDYWRENAALTKLTSEVKSAYNSLGYIRGIDGRRLQPRGEHMALNYLFQNAGSMVVKAATCFMWQAFDAAGLHGIKQVWHMHDEIGFEVDEGEDMELITRLIQESWVRAGEFFKLNVKIEGDVKIGKSWAEVH